MHPSHLKSVVFLDLDGVLNNHSLLQLVFRRLDKRLVRMFVGWAQARPDVGLVLSSSWRLNYQDIHDAALDLSRRFDLVREDKTSLNWVGMTDSIAGAPRHAEIWKWLKQNPQVQHFAILDDMTDMGPLQEYLVQTNPRLGITNASLIQLTKTLQRGLPPNLRASNVVRSVS